MTGRNGRLLPFRRGEPVEEEMSDGALLAAIGIGETAALGTLFDRYYDRVHRYVGRMACSDDRDLDDLVQMTFLEVRRSAAQFAGRSTVESWIMGIAVNVVRHHVRGEIRRRRLVTALAEHPRGPGAAPDVAAARTQMMELLQVALAELPSTHREVFVLCDLECVPGVEAARVLGIREGTMWRRLHEARKRLRLALAKVVR